MQAVRVEVGTERKLTFGEFPLPEPLPNEALVRIQAVSLNRGEVRRSFTTAPDGWRPGWDLAGVVEQAAANSAGPKVGQPVVGMVRAGAWAEYAVVPVDQLAVIPEGVTLEQAATLPVAGLTALHSLYKGGVLLAKSVLVTGATGGVGDFAIQLARRAGAIVTAHIRRADQEAFVRKAGAEHIVVGERLAEAAAPYAPYDLIIESVGGEVLGSALTMLSERGVCVNFGTSGDKISSFNVEDFYFIGGATLYGLILFDELKWHENATLGLTRLMTLIQRGDLSPQITVEASMSELPAVANGLLNRKYLGKAVLRW